MSDEARLETICLNPVAGPPMDPIVLRSGTRSVLGRAAECDFCLHEPSVSRQHVAIECREGQWFVTDLGSRGGTTLSRVELTAHQSMPIALDDLLGIGPFMFRVGPAATGRAAMEDPAAGSRRLATMSPFDAPGTLVEAVPTREFDSIAHRRLALIIEGCASIHQASTEAELAQAVVKLMISGTGFPRAAMLRWGDSLDQVEIIASHEHERDTPDGMVVSRSLLQAAADGSVARLSNVAQVDHGQSIAELGIVAALCTPLVVDSTVVGAVYLDARQGEASPQPDAASFCQAVSQVAGVALSSLKRIELATRQKQLDADLEIAQEAQSFLLPAPQGTVGNLRYASRSCAGSVIGGDLFDIFAVDESRTGICFGDITGHGIGAAVLMSAVISHLRATLAHGGDPAAAVTDVNAYLVEHSSSRMFATLWVGVYDATTKVLSYVDAGHGHWLICDGDAAPACPQTPGGLMIGLQPDFEYASARLDLKPGDRIILYSDGIVEQPDKQNNRFENDRLESVIAHSDSISDDVAEVFAALEAFSGSSTFMDDTTLASIEILAG